MIQSGVDHQKTVLSMVVGAKAVQTGVAKGVNGTSGRCCTRYGRKTNTAIAVQKYS
jgi:hypothetical protein